MASSLLRRRIEKRAFDRCEYCLAPQNICGYRFHLEHIIPLSEGGSNSEANLALACATCNLVKSILLTARDPVTGEVVPIFHPRRQRWDENFDWDIQTSEMIGKTPVGRATVSALDMNTGIRISARQFWFEVGFLPFREDRN